MKSNNNLSEKEINFPSNSIISWAGFICVAFIGLKLSGYTEVASWNWWWVLSPLWITFSLIIFFLLFLKWYDKP